MSNEQRITWLTSVSHFVTHGYMTLLPAVLVVIAGDHSMSFFELGVIANIGYFLYGLGSFPSGYLADRYGSKRVLSVGILGMGASSVLVGLSQSTLSFALAYALLGVFASIHHPAGLSLIARRIMTMKGKALGVHGVMGNLGMTLSPLTASLFVFLFGSWRASYIAYGLIGMVFGVLFQRTRVELEDDFSLKELVNRRSGSTGGRMATPAKTEPRPAVPVVIPVALVLLMIDSILSGFIFRGTLTFMPSLFQREVLFITNHDEPVVLAGFVTSAVLSLGLIGSWFGGWLNDKVKIPELLPVIIFAVTAPALYFLSRYTDGALLFWGCVFSLFFYAWQPSQNFLVAKYTRMASMGIGFGVNFFLIFGMGSVATAVGGYTADHYGVDRFYWLMAIVAATALLVTCAVFTVHNRQIRFSWRSTDKAEASTT